MIKQFPFLAEKNNYLQWTLALKGQIVPEKCITRLSLMNLELKLVKVKSVFWGSLLSNGEKFASCNIFPSARLEKQVSI